MHGVLTQCSNTIGPSDNNSIDETIRGEFIGFTVEGGPIVRFLGDQVIEISEHAELLGRCEDTKSSVVAYRKDSIRFLSDDQEATVEEIEATGKGKQEQKTG